MKEKLAGDVGLSRNYRGVGAAVPAARGMDGMDRMDRMDGMDEARPCPAARIAVKPA